MRPLKLDVKGFTAFREAQDLDFSKLDVFAIAGPTGSGKSSLLDAMTYALYGRVERVGDRVSQLISQGQPRMAVTLEFAVGKDRYRITRSTPAKGATKILLERMADDGWKQAGEGADRVKDAEKTIERLIGLTYDGFTRSVLLPQGKFAEFLVGDPKKRRDILTELLGLSLFRRMAERAGAISKESSVRAQTMNDMVAGEYAGVTSEAVKEAKRTAKEAEKHEALVGQAAEEVLEILRRWQEAEQSIDEVEGCLQEALRTAQTVDAIAEDLPAAANELLTATEAVSERNVAAKAARNAAKEAQTELRVAIERVGSTAVLGRAQGHAHALVSTRDALTAKEAELAAAKEGATVRREALLAAERTLKERSEEFTALEMEVAAAEEAAERARHEDLVAAVAAGLKAGDPCPVCATPLRAAPKRATGTSLRTATRALDRVKSAAGKAAAALREAERHRDAADRDLQANLAEQQRIRDEIQVLKSKVKPAQRALAAVFGDSLPDDPLGAIEERLEQIRHLELREREATEEVANATETLLRAEQERDRAAAHAERLRERLVFDRAELLRRAARALDDPKRQLVIPTLPSSADVGRLQLYAKAMSQAFHDLAEDLRKRADEQSSIERHLLVEANTKVAGFVEPQADLKGLAASLNAECRKATAMLANAKQRAADLAERLKRKEQLGTEIRSLEERARLFKTMANELRADHLIAFLQAEALHILASAASERLAALSEGRYRLAFRNDEFFVVDTWNGDEQRSVRTLSGGETFLASLALALALANQVRSLAVTDRASLDSLFLDEGFGTLDQETLRTVVGAIEQLAGDGRLVGVITHVPELAEQFPRITVEKSPRGSRLRLVAS
ncbi:MAG: SMC family ATPase [Actinomycetota bacterium]|nr:SMC family ATPase [Actinomycetota bacterium]